MTAVSKDDYAGESSDYRSTFTDVTRNYIRKGTVTSDVVMNREQIFLVTGVPHRGDPWGPDDLGAWCNGIAIDDDADNQLIYRWTATYTNDWGKEDPDDQQNDPRLRRTKWRYTSQAAQRTQAKDAKGKAYQTTAGEPFRTPPVIRYATGRYTVTRPEATFSSDIADSFAMTVNTAPWYGKPANTVLLEGIQADDHYDGDAGGKIYYWLVTYTLHVDRHGWNNVEVANKGSYYFDGAGFPVGNKTFPKQNGVASGEIVWLSGVGGLLADNAARTYIEFDPYDEADINFFNL